MDAWWMAEAIAAAETAVGRVAPNPAVGCVLVADGEVVASGTTEPPPGRHAEAVALDRAGERARGTTAYVTLEPCAHHGRTPPCADALAAAGVARVVHAVRDPDPGAAGGAARLAEAGVTVTGGVGAERARWALAPFLCRVTAGRPLVTVKLATSLDGRTAAADGTSQWITGGAARELGHRLRAAVGAVLVGSGTVLADDPRLTARHDASAPQPLRVVLDRRARTRPEARAYDAAASSLAVVGPDADDAHLRRGGVEVRRLGVGEGLEDLLASLVDRGVDAVLVEGGARLAGAVVAAGLADRIVAHVAPLALGEDGQPALAGLSVPTLAAAPRWRTAGVGRAGDDAVLTLEA